MSHRPELLIKNGELAGKRYKVKSGGLRLGRSSSNDIHVPDEELSRNHCLFEPVDDDDIRLTDLASANGTIVNGNPLGGDPVVLKVGDTVEVGSLVISVIDPDAPLDGPKVDLGFDAAVPEGSTKGYRRSPFANVLWAFVVLFMAAAIYLVLSSDRAPAKAAAPTAVIEKDPSILEVVYEKVEANADGIFRYEMTLSRDRVLRVTVDDVPKENRHLSKSQVLSESAMATLNEILSLKVICELDREYAGAEPDPPALSSLMLKVVYEGRARTIRVANTQEPEQFRSVREKLEAFSKNELGVWAMQYSRDKLVELATEATNLGRAKYEDRDVNYGNLAAAVAAFREAIFYLETVNPKPDCYREAQTGLETAVAELNRRYADQRFLADRACNLGQWETAKRELGILLEMVPDRMDDRNREAMAKLMDVENRMKKGDR